MDHIDYIRWAEDYRSQAELITQKIEARSKMKKFATAEERSEFEKGTQMLYEMRRECRITEALLLERAALIKEAEEHEKNI